MSDTFPETHEKWIYLKDDRERVQSSYYSDPYESYNNAPGYHGYMDDSYQGHHSPTDDQLTQRQPEYNAAKFETENYFNKISSNKPSHILTGIPSYSNSFISLNKDAPIRPAGSNSGARKSTLHGSGYDPFYPDFNTFGTPPVSRYLILPRVPINMGIQWRF